MPPHRAPRMTANPVKPSRYRPGKPLAETRSSSDSEADQDDGASDASANEAPAARQPSKQPPPKASSFPADTAKKVATNLRNVDLNERRRQDEARERAQKAKEYRERQQQERDAGFVTESESDDESSSDANRDTTKSPQQQQQQHSRKQDPSPTSTSDEQDSGSDSSDADTDSSDSSAAAVPRRRAAPVFLRKDQRGKGATTSTSAAAAEESAQARAEADAARRAAETDAMVQERLERDAAARAAGKKSWDDDEPDAEGLVDDTDGLDPALEHAQWVARELGRLKRARAALEAREAEIAEVERRRALATPEREAEDRAHVDAQREEKQGRAKAAFMQRYHHRGAFYNDDDAEARGLLQRDLMGATYEGSTGMKEALPQYLQVRDATMIGRKGRTRYRDLKTEDTGRWGDLGRDPRRGAARAGNQGGGAPFADDERFRPDRDASGPSGANASAVGERKRPHGDDQSRLDDTKRPKRDEEPVR